ncbi:MAG: outer membrane beta-barrel protein [Candidatus Cryptobacteroides sp.]
MKKLLAMALFLSAALTASANGDWKGKVIDENGEPVAYATVAVLSQADSTLVCGTTAGEDGTFNIVTKETNGVMMVAMLGYQTQYLAPADGITVVLKEDAALLQGTVVTAVMPKTKLTGEGLQTSVRGSVLENVGSANDVLAKTPGIIKGQDGLEVIGKGAPLVYINGRKVTDATELDRLQSNEIQSVEVITNPGAQYDATVRSVVRIRTVKRQGDGFGFNLTAADSQSLRWDRGNGPFAALNANYRTGGVDIFAGVNYSRNTSRQQSDLVKNTYGKDFELTNRGDLLNEYIGESIYGNAGVNWQIADAHFVGGKIEWGRNLSYSVHTVVNDNVTINGLFSDSINTVSDDALADNGISNLGANIYYNGLIGGKLGIDINLDYYGTGYSTASASHETSAEAENRILHSGSSTDGKMYAAKAVLSYPVWKGQLQVGTEESFSRRSDDYTISGIDIPASQADVEEDNCAGFVNYGFFIPRAGQFSAGVRYEHVRYAYRDALAPENDITRGYANWFPTASWATAFGPVQIMLNYSVRTRRPNYGNLSSAIRYNSRYLWQSGNAQLQPEISHNASITAIWKFITFMVNYTRTDDAIMVWSSAIGDEGVVLVKPRNIESPYRNLSAFVNFTPTIGCWTMNWTVGAQPQWLTIEAPDPREADGIRVTRFNDKPMFFAQLFNTFTVRGGWQFELGASLMTSGYTQNMHMTNNYCDVSAAIQKVLLRDGSLVLRLEGADLLGMAHFNMDTDFGSHTISQTNLMDTQKVKLSIRYSFNTAQSKYRGTGAGADSKSRM